MRPPEKRPIRLLRLSDGPAGRASAGAGGSRVHTFSVNGGIHWSGVGSCGEIHLDGISHRSGKARTKRPAPPPNPGPTPDDYLEALLTLLPPRVILRITRETGVVQRQRKIDPVAFHHTLAFETGPQLQRTVEALRDAYNQRVPDPILRMGRFDEWFTPRRRNSTGRSLRPRPAPVRSREPPHPKLARFPDLLIQDSTVIRLFAALAKFCP